MITIAAAALRWHSFFYNTFAADEALFATWARTIATGKDIFLTNTLVDKPPLLFYSQALFYPLVGPVQWAARLPNLIASLLTVPLVAVVGWRLSRSSGAAILAAGLVALSPLAIQFSSTAYTDPLLTFWLLCAMLAAVKRHPAQTVFFFSLALLTKYQAVLFLPFLLLLTLRGFIYLSGATSGRAKLYWLMSIFNLGLFGWWVSRGLIARQVNNFGGIRPITSTELVPRLFDWHDVASDLSGSPFWLILVLIIGVQIWRPTQWRGLFLGFLLGYLAFHWLLAIPVWERYLLPLVPIVCVLSAESIITLTRSLLPQMNAPRRRADGVSFSVRNFYLKLALTPPQSGRSMQPGGIKFAPAIAAIGLCCTILPQALVAQAGQPDADNGTAQVALALEDAPYGTVLYDHWSSWQWRHHFFDKRVHVEWVPNPDRLLADLAEFYDNNRFVALPDDDSAEPFLRALKSASYQLESVAHAHGSPGTKLYKIHLCINQTDECNGD